VTLGLIDKTLEPFDTMDPPNTTHSTAEILNSRFPELSTNVPNSTYVCIVACQDAVSYRRRKCDAEI